MILVAKAADVVSEHLQGVLFRRLWAEEVEGGVIRDGAPADEQGDDEEEDIDAVTPQDADEEQDDIEQQDEGKGQPEVGDQCQATLREDEAGVGRNEE